MSPPFLDLLLPLNMSSAEDLSYHHVSAGVGGNGSQSSPGINGSASQNGQPGLTKRKKGRKPKGLDGTNGSLGANGANGTGNGGVGKRKSRESTFSFTVTILPTIRYALIFLTGKSDSQTIVCQNLT